MCALGLGTTISRLRVREVRGVGWFRQRPDTARLSAEVPSAFRPSVAGRYENAGKNRLNLNIGLYIFKSLKTRCVGVGACTATTFFSGDVFNNSLLIFNLGRLLHWNFSSLKKITKMAKIQGWDNREHQALNAKTPT